MLSITLYADLKADRGLAWRFVTTIIILALIISACAPVTDAPDQAAQLLAADRAFAQASLDGTAAQAFAAYLAENALSLPAGGNPVSGREAIVAGMAGDFTLSWSPQHAEVAASGDLGWTWGTYQLSRQKDDGSTAVSHGKYLNVWRKDSSGQWKVAVDLGSSSPPPE